MDTRKLVAGQYVHMVSSGIYANAGKVVKVTPTGVEVRTFYGHLLIFDANGNETDASRRERLGFGPSPGDKFLSMLWASS
jgi:hypothetical protein